MLVFIWPRDDATGQLDDEFKDGDIFRVAPDSDESGLGVFDTQSWLVVKIPDPPNQELFEVELVGSEYAPGASPTEPNVVRHKRKYYCNWRSKFSEAEIQTIEDQSVKLSDGQLSSGGTVAAGVVSGKFTVQDFLRK